MKEDYKIENENEKQKCMYNFLWVIQKFYLQNLKSFTEFIEQKEFKNNNMW